MTFYAEQYFTKSEMMEVLVEYLRDKECSTQDSLFGQVEEILRRQGIIGDIASDNMRRKFEMSNEDRRLFNECFYDLLYGRAITPGSHKHYPDLPHFHVNDKEKLQSFIVKE